MKAIEFNPDSKSTAFLNDQAQMNNILPEILPVIFHKLKNKLTPILGYAQILQFKTSDAFTIERLRKIENNANELTDLLNILKDYFIIESPARQPGNINHILQKLNPFWQKLAASEKIKIVLDLDPAIPEISLNETQLQMLLLNMTANSLQALRSKKAKKKEIHLTTNLKDGHLKLLVRDNGIGMNKEELANIWTPFYSRYSDSAGLGLVICEKIIANHDATCKVCSRPGKFSQFEIVFPAAAVTGPNKKESALICKRIKK